MRPVVLAEVRLRALLHGADRLFPRCGETPRYRTSATEQQPAAERQVKTVTSGFVPEILLAVFPVR